MKGVSPFRATIYEQARWRCNLCDFVVTAPVPAGVGPDKYDASVAALLALPRYGVGLPHTRIALFITGQSGPEPRIPLGSPVGFPSRP